MFFLSEHALLNIHVFSCFFNELRQSVARKARGRFRNIKAHTQLAKDRTGGTH